MSAPEPRILSQLRHDVDDVYALVDATNQTVSALAATQRRHGVRLEEIQQTLDLHSARFDRMDARFDGMGARFDGMDARFDRMEETQRQMLDLLRGRADTAPS